MKIREIFLCFSLFLNNELGHCTVNDEHMADTFRSSGVKGTMVLSSLDGDVDYIFNSERANTYLTPASTFKIPNAIIALEKNIVSNPQHIIKWNGQKHDLKVWEQDQNLKSAFKSSCIWFFQHLARQIGEQTYLRYLEKFGYGNCLIGGNIDTFWLKDGGELRITPVQQMNFLKRLYRKELDISDETYKVLQDIMLEEDVKFQEGDLQCAFYSKTGAATKNWVGHGWYVGYVEVNHQVWFFVSNIEIKTTEDLPKRKNIVLDVLRKKQIITSTNL